MAELVGTGYKVPKDRKFYDAADPRSQKAWKHAVAIMEMVTFTDAEDALSNLDPENGLSVDDWQYEVANGDTGAATRTGSPQSVESELIQATDLSSRIFWEEHFHARHLQPR